MNRVAGILFGPEVALALLTGAIYLFCVRHSSYGSEDVRAIERMIWLCPFLAVAVGFATYWLPGARTWWWMGRLNLSLLATLVVSALLLIDKLGKPGSGPHGQDGAFIVIVSFGVIFSAIGNSFLAASLLRAQRPGLDAWFQLRPVLGHVLTFLAAIPVGTVQVIVTCFTLGILMAVYSGLSR